MISGDFAFQDIIHDCWECGNDCDLTCCVVVFDDGDVVGDAGQVTNKVGDWGRCRVEVVVVVSVGWEFYCVMHCGWGWL